MFDGHGKWEFSVDDTLVRFINKSQENRNEQFSKIRSYIFVQYLLSDPSEYNQTDSLDTNPYGPESINNYIKTMEYIGVKLKFTPSQKKD
jgi:hypothetical protein